jgi:spore maturation protein CgeB
MRTYEAIGCGAFLIGEDGIYPEPLVPGEDLYTYRSLPELIDQIERVLALPDQGRTLALRTRDKLRRRCSKARQWQVFVESVQSLGR